MDLHTAREILALFDSREHAIAEVSAACQVGHDTIILSVKGGIGFISVERVTSALVVYNLAN